MSRLYHTENGHVVPTLCEELTRFRRARKVLELPATSRPATLYILARPYADPGVPPLRIAVNGVELPPTRPEPWVFYRWFQIEVRHDLLRAGENLFEFWTDATAMNAWSLAIEPGHTSPRSFLSDDGGATWRNQRMGYLHALQGEYVVRIRLAEGQDPPPPPIEWEDLSCPRFESLRCRMPPEALGDAVPLDRARALATWVARSWKHNGTGLGGVQYAPWDPETILEWGRTLCGHNGRNPIVNCVHYAVVFSACAQAAGIPARCCALEGDPLGLGGHFINEIWLDDLNKWAMVDANLDAMFWKDGLPMSIAEIQRAGGELNRYVKWGPGTQLRLAEWGLSAGDFEHLNPFDKYLNGVTFRHRSVWRRADSVSRPSAAPPGHGTLCYCETELVWERGDVDRGLGMFPCFGDAAWFDASPG